LTQGRFGAGIHTAIFLADSGAMAVTRQSFMTDDFPQKDPIVLRIRQALALPIYAIALILDFASDALGMLAAKIAGDPS
jgi:hypothetical protein